MTQEINYKELCEQQAAVIEQMREALIEIQWISYDDLDWGTTVFCPACGMEKSHGHYDTCIIKQALALQPASIPEDLAKDAARYLFLRNRVIECAKFGKLLSGGVALDTAIDAAMAKEGE